ncbi:hypothetical protein JXA32_06420 [Candidatus Sumerlaeota bacterium]|nr:hypothetical protein [Candidatus Sumerlaeota bacterium]
MATALEAYCVDHNAYPPYTMDPAKQACFKTPFRMPSFSIEAGSLTTPIGYLARYPLDEFSRWSEERTFAYFTSDNGQDWIVVSIALSAQIRNHDRRD